MVKEASLRLEMGGTVGLMERGACPAVASRARFPLNVTICAARSEIVDSFLFRGRRKASTSPPVIVPWRSVIALMMPRRDMCRVFVLGSERARRFDSPIPSRMAAQKAAEHASQVALDSVARLKASRAAALAFAARRAGFGKSGLTLNGPPGGVLRVAQRVPSHTPNRNSKASHSANTARAARLLVIFHGTKLVCG